MRIIPYHFASINQSSLSGGVAIKKTIIAIELLLLLVKFIQ